MRKVLVTGGSGFIGSNFIRWLLKHRSLEVENLDNFTYAGNRANLKDLEANPRYHLTEGDVADPKKAALALKDCGAVVHFAAETHVDRSIVDSSSFLRTNVLGTHVLLEAAKAAGVEKFVHISTDEVYGSLEQGAADESFPLHPNSPYSASKAGADHLVSAYGITHRLPAVILRASNNYGPYQFPEKFLPLMITNALEGIPLPIYGDGRYVREWLFVEDFCEAVGLALEKGVPGEIYNVGSGEHQVNLEVAGMILRALGKPQDLLQHVTDRPGHDRRYALRSDKIRALGWSPAHQFPEGLQATMEWYRQNERWWRPLKARAWLPPNLPARA
ncbi:MAG: dTDP-glucose 4,6-dehydratase [Candidatus Omnitrophica bacterium]|nr:dTDP-glucose 4,6-dehydratase [Candidatus Omnitrophota bacterium]